MRGVAKSVGTQLILDQFASANCRNFGMTLAEFRGKLQTARRLDRRIPSGPQAGTWEPSSSVLVEGDPSLVARLLAAQTAFYDYRAVALRPYELPVRRCYHCGAAGHIARHCRSACTFCGHRHATRDCPSGNRVYGSSLGPVRGHSTAAGDQRPSDTQPDSLRPTRGHPTPPSAQPPSPASQLRPCMGDSC